jgi:hypothetical protein
VRLTRISINRLRALRVLRGPCESYSDVIPAAGREALGALVSLAQPLQAHALPADADASAVEAPSGDRPMRNDGAPADRRSLPCIHPSRRKRRSNFTTP